MRIAATLALILTFSSYPSDRVSAAPSAHLFASCTPPLASESLSKDNVYPVADRLFKHGNYEASAQAYYQTFVCDRKPLFAGLNGHVFEGDFFFEFQAAIAQAVTGKFVAAAARMRHIKRELPPFTEAGYLAGIFTWAAGDHASARHLWRETLGGTRFALPDDTPDTAQTATRRMLEWTRKR